MFQISDSEKEFNKSILFKFLGMIAVQHAVKYSPFNGHEFYVFVWIGVLSFLIGVLFDNKSNPNKTNSWIGLLAHSIFVLIWVGLFASVLRYCANSADRSLWFIPLSFTAGVGLVVALELYSPVFSKKVPLRTFVLCALTSVWFNLGWGIGERYFVSNFLIYNMH